MAFHAIVWLTMLLRNVHMFFPSFRSAEVLNYTRVVLAGKSHSHPISFPEPTCLLVSTKTPYLGRYVYTGIQSYGVPLRSKYPNSEMLFQKQNISRDVQNMMPKIIIYRSRPKKKYVRRVPVYLTKYSIMRFSMGK